MKTAYIAFGSNLGDRHKNVDAALSELSLISETPLRVSSLWETETVDIGGAAPIRNGVVCLGTRLEPPALLSKLQAIEEALGRPRDHGSNLSRQIDLDIVCVDDLVMDSPQLTLPHPRARERRFVLAPLAEIAPDLLLPGESDTVTELLEKAPPLAMRRL
ncbi:MAG: 2-amino-4-hydroxy-6-hydroxymethyldihydropteridine diphosphokinase [Pseudomonadales bacterium]|nr:2-amino-4-hydroxy-6-hydroxymethyldihydropteridine diphosphokinase [Pseudomonadales bacterium]